MKNSGRHVKGTKTPKTLKLCKNVQQSQNKLEKSVLTSDLVEGSSSFEEMG